MAIPIRLKPLADFLQEVFKDMRAIDDPNEPRKEPGTDYAAEIARMERTANEFQTLIHYHKLQQTVSDLASQLAREKQKVRELEDHIRQAEDM